MIDSLTPGCRAGTITDNILAPTPVKLRDSRRFQREGKWEGEPAVPVNVAPGNYRWRRWHHHQEQHLPVRPGHTTSSCDTPPRKEQPWDPAHNQDARTLQEGSKHLIKTCQLWFIIASLSLLTGLPANYWPCAVCFPLLQRNIPLKITSARTSNFGWLVF